MKHLTILLSLLFAFSSIALYGQTSKWTNYDSALGKYSIRMPAEAKVTIDEQEELKIEKTEARDGYITFTSSVRIYNTELIDSESLTEQALNSFVDAVGGRSISQGVWKVKKEKGILAVISVNDDTRLEYRVITIGRRQIELITLIEIENEFKSKLIKKFFKSFKLY